MTSANEPASDGPMSRREVIKLGAGTAALSALGERAQAAGKRYGVIDCHAHWLPEPYLAAMKDLGRPLAPDPINYDLDRHLKRMDEQGIDVHILSILTPAIQWAKPAEGAGLAAIVNDAAVAAHRLHPDRLFASVALPIQDPALALKELDRVAGKPGICAIHLPTSNDAKDFLFEPSFEPIFARAAALKLPLVLHPIGAVAGGDRLEGPEFLNNTIGFPFEHTITAARFITSGVLDRHPELDIVLFHAGGAFPYLASRIEAGFARRKIKLARPFEDYVRRFHYDTITFNAAALRFLIERVGADRVVIGSDNYAFMDLDRPRALVEGLNLADADRERILTGNTVRLFRL